MGFFSYKCRSCNLSLLNGTSVGGGLVVLSKVVAVGYNGIMYRGMYNGYGSVNGEDLLQDARDGIISFDEIIYTQEELDESGVELESKVPALYHECCFDETVHKDYIGGSESCEFQGHFFDSQEIKELIGRNKVFRTNFESFYGRSAEELAIYG
jgi:hypothetical protein